MRVEGGCGEWASAISAAEMKGQERIFMFTANIALKTKKKEKVWKHKKKIKLFKIPETPGPKDRRGGKKPKECGA